MAHLVRGCSLRAALRTLVLICVVSCRATNDDKTVWAESGGVRCEDNSTTRRAPRDLLHASEQSVDSDSRLARATASVPGGFGGIFRENDRTVVLLIDTGQQRRAAQVLRELPGLPIPLDSQFVFRKSRWTFQDLVDWRQFLAVRSKIPEIRSSYIDEAGNRIIISVADEASRVIALRRFKFMTIPCMLVAIEVVGTPRTT